MRRRPKTRAEVMALAVLKIVQALDQAYRHHDVGSGDLRAILGAALELRIDGGEGLRIRNRDEN